MEQKKMSELVNFIIKKFPPINLLIIKVAKRAAF
jgi:hypothetical protein